jgi:hypothetical protein
LQNPANFEARTLKANRFLGNFQQLTSLSAKCCNGHYSAKPLPGDRPPARSDFGPRPPHSDRFLSYTVAARWNFSSSFRARVGKNMLPPGDSNQGRPTRPRAAKLRSASHISQNFFVLHTGTNMFCTIQCPCYKRKILTSFSQFPFVLFLRLPFSNNSVFLLVCIICIKIHII